MVEIRLSQVVNFQLSLRVTPEKAIDKLKSRIVGMVITDMEMGVMTAEHVMKYVRKKFGPLSAILMSGNPDNLRREG